MAELRRKLYRRGSSYETTIPMPLLFALDTSKKHVVIFRFDPKHNRWYVDFEPAPTGEKEEKKKRG
ncbi:hypothetical protein HY772_08780 [Candidatus Woesearchaeota archaeon]|nr:hypothetical protein [Candidatus Woesearchaeota archaeon]